MVAVRELSRMRTPVTILVSKEEILSGDVSRVRSILDSFVPEALENNRNRIIVNVLGYSDDSRELYLIGEVRNWFHCLFDSVPELFFWLNLTQPWLTFYAIMHGTPIRQNEGTTVSREDLEHFLIWGYEQLNQFCNKHSVPVEPSNTHVRNAIGIRRLQ
jgi:hypothetical protein